MDERADPPRRSRMPPTTADLGDPGVRNSYQRHRWLVFFMGLGSGLLGILLAAGLRRGIEEGGWGGVCLIMLILVPVLIIALALFIISFIIAVIFGLIGRGKSPWMRLLGVSPVLAIFAGFIVGPVLGSDAGLLAEDNAGGFTVAGFWIGVALINLNAALLIPPRHAEARWGGILTSFLPPVSLLGVALSDLDSSVKGLAALSAPLIAAGVASVIIFIITGQILAKYPVVEERYPEGG